MEYYNSSTIEAYLSTPSMYTTLSDVTESIVNSSPSNPYEELIAAANATLAPEPSTIAYKYLKSITRILNWYFTPVITIAGTIGNILSVMVFLRTKLKKLSSSYYLAFLAIFDTGFLWCWFIEWLNIFKIGLHKTDGFCQLFTWLSNACSVLSVWLVVAFTIERFVAVMYPLKRQSMYTVRRARCIVCSLVAFNAISSAPLLFMTNIVIGQDGMMLCTVDGIYQVSKTIFI